MLTDSEEIVVIGHILLIIPFPDEALAYQERNRRNYLKSPLVPLSVAGSTEELFAIATYTFNTAPAIAEFNSGPKQRLEHLINAKAREVGQVEVWTGTEGTLGVLRGTGNFTVNIPAVLWRVVKFGNVTQCYMLRNDDSGIANETSMIDLVTLKAHLHFNPMEIIRN